MTKRAPHYTIHYEDTELFQQALRKAQGNADLVDPDDFYREREVTTLAAAKSVRRALERRGHSVHGIYERINLQEVSQEGHSEEYRRLHRGEVEWEWEREEEICEGCLSIDGHVTNKKKSLYGSLIVHQRENSK